MGKFLPAATSTPSPGTRKSYAGCMAKNQQEYADAIDTINQKVAAGEMTAGEAEVWRQRLLVEASAKPRPMWAKVLIFVAVVIIGIIILRLVAVASGA